MPEAREAAGPRFICIGSQKAGTDWVYDQFSSHRDFRMPPLKEIHYFNRAISQNVKRNAWRKVGWMATVREMNADRERDVRFLLRLLHPDPVDPADMGGYCEMFHGLTENGKWLTGDVCPGYLPVDEPMIDSMRSGLRNTTFFAIVRDPVERLWSQVLMHQRWQDAPVWRDRAILSLERAETPGGIAWFLGHPGVTRLSFIARKLAYWQTVMGGDFRVFFFDELRESPEQFRNELCGFLDVDRDGFGVPASFNRKAAQTGKVPIGPVAELEAHRCLHGEYARLANLLGGRAQRWLDRHAARMDALSSQS